MKLFIKLQPNQSNYTTKTPTKPQLEFWSDTFYKIRLKLCPISLLSHFMSFYCNKNCSNGGKLVVWANSILEYCVDTNDVDDST